MKHPASLFLAALAACLPLAPARAGVLTLHNFNGGPGDGARPTGSLTVIGSKLYGMSSRGGSANRGTIFSMNADGTGFGLLHQFTNAGSEGIHPNGDLTLSGSKFFGMTTGGSSGGGAIFSINTDGTGLATLHSFDYSATDGGNPLGSSLTLAGTKLFGMTYFGGAAGQGTLFTMNTDGTGFSLLHSFDGSTADGGAPVGSLTLSGSKLYGMTSQGGDNSTGALFSIETDGSDFSLLHSFNGTPGDGTNPEGSLTLSGSTIYGMTKDGGANDSGTLFTMNTDGTGFTILHDFLDQFLMGGENDGSHPQGTLTLVGSTLYGLTTMGGAIDAGTVFRIGTDGSGFELLDTFYEDVDEGAAPLYTQLIPSADGTVLYGMTELEGTGTEGTLFSLDLPAIPEPGTTLFGVALVGLVSGRRMRRS